MELGIYHFFNHAPGFPPIISLFTKSPETQLNHQPDNIGFHYPLIRELLMIFFIDDIEFSKKSSDYELVISDIRMPSVNGYEFVKQA
jgi:CheY-like chemotaxis protein